MRVASYFRLDILTGGSVGGVLLVMLAGRDKCDRVTDT